MKSIQCLFIFSISILFSYNLFSQAEKSPDEIAINQIVESMQNGWNAKSGEQFATNFAEEHDYLVWNGIYTPNSSKTHNAETHQWLYDGPYKKMDIELKLDKVRFVKPDVALVHVLTSGHDTGGTIPPFPTHLITMVLKKSVQKWEIVSFHNLDVEYHELLRTPAPTEEAKIAYAKKHYANWYK